MGGGWSRRKGGTHGPQQFVHLRKTPVGNPSQRHHKLVTYMYFLFFLGRLHCNPQKWTPEPPLWNPLRNLLHAKPPPEPAWNTCSEACSEVYTMAEDPKASLSGKNTPDKMQLTFWDISVLGEDYLRCDLRRACQRLLTNLPSTHQIKSFSFQHRDRGGRPCIIQDSKIEEIPEYSEFPYSIWNCFWRARKKHSNRRKGLRQSIMLYSYFCKNH